eukprot:COSAG01_NODE_373_length_17991_cov_284.890075_18_plen_125_part_00
MPVDDDGLIGQGVPCHAPGEVACLPTVVMIRTEAETEIPLRLYSVFVPCVLRADGRMDGKRGCISPRPPHEHIDMSMNAWPREAGWAISWRALGRRATGTACTARQYGGGSEQDRAGRGSSLAR